MDNGERNPPDEIVQALEALPLFVSVKQAAAFLNLNTETVRSMAKNGELASVRPQGHHMRILRSAIAQYLEKYLCPAQDKAHDSSSCPEKTTGTSKMEMSDEMVAASRFQQELRIGRKLSAH